VDISPYKFNHAGGKGQPEWVHVAPVPDSYRGKYRCSEHSEQQLADLYAAEVVTLVEAAEARGRRIALFLAESYQSCGGQIVYPKTYLSQVYKYLQSKGIRCLADEVQCGFFRSGDAMWGFQAHGKDIVPDFVTIGKSMGNGHPVAALVTTPELGATFGAKGMHYFNTFGGNPASMAAANAVLDVLENEKMQDHVLSVSKHLLSELNRLKAKFPIIGDVRGHGYFIGVDFVQSRVGREPATATAAIILQKMRERFILLSLDGPYSNVMKFKPPLCFNMEDSDHLVANLEAVLSELVLSPVEV